MTKIRQTVLPPATFRALKREESRRAAAETPRGSPRAKMGFIPTPAMLASLIDDAIEALARGITWDRGAIVNIVL